MSHQQQDLLASMGNVSEFRRPGFWLDRAGVIQVISEVWDLDPSDRDSWWIGAFGDGLAASVERLTDVVFAPRRGLVGGPRLDVRLFTVAPDSPARPMMLGVSEGDGPIVCRGIEDIAEVLPDTFGRGPEHVVDGLEALLVVASGLIPQPASRRGFEWLADPASHNGSQGPARVAYL